MLHNRMLDGEPSDLSSDDEVAILRAENQSLQSLLFGLCVSLAQMSEVHREVVIQALAIAGRTPGARPHEPGKLREAILAIIQPVGLSARY